MSKRSCFSGLKIFDGAVTGTNKSSIKSKNVLNQELVPLLAENSHKPIIKKFEKRKVY